MAEIKVYFLDTGIPTLLQGPTDFFGVSLHSFLVGNSANFVPDETEIYPRGDLVYTGLRDSMVMKSLDDNKSLQVSLLFPEGADNVDIGNIMLFASYRGRTVPFASVVLSEIVRKTNPTSNITDQNLKAPGNRLIISVTIRYISGQELGVDYNINVVVPNYANLPYFGNDADVPSPDVNPHSNFIVNEMDGLGDMPAFVTKGANNEGYYASPLFQNIDSPKFGIINSFGADKHGNDRIGWVWGQRFTTLDSDFKGIAGGLDFDDMDSTAVVIGGLPFEEE